MIFHVFIPRFSTLYLGLICFFFRVRLVNAHDLVTIEKQEFPLWAYDPIERRCIQDASHF